MDTGRIAELLQPFLELANAQRLTTDDLLNISTYIDLLLRWNARINLTAVRQPEEIVTRHFGESLFAARHLFPAGTTLAQLPEPALSEVEGAVQAEHSSASTRLIDIGSGAGFPGLPIKIWAPEIDVTLIESNQKRATFLREVTRRLTLTNINVFAGRAEAYPNPPANVVTLRAVEHFEKVLPIATSLVAPGGRLALLIGQAQLEQTHNLAPELIWTPSIPIPLSASRVLAISARQAPERHEPK
jgi:16S rRNA (guanine527-N7)-methyltransferase